MDMGRQKRLLRLRLSNKRFASLSLCYHRTLGGFLRVSLALDWWGNWKGPRPRTRISTIKFPLYPLRRPYRLI